MSTLYDGDNLDIPRRYLADETADLVYLDPPFNCNATLAHPQSGGSCKVRSVPRERHPVLAVRVP